MFVSFVGLWLAGSFAGWLVGGLAGWFGLVWLVGLLARFVLLSKATNGHSLWFGAPPPPPARHEVGGWENGLPFADPC